MARGKKEETNGKNSNGANLDFEQTLWAAADKMRGHVDAAEYKHVALGLIFLKYISDEFLELYDDLAARQETEYTGPADWDELHGVEWLLGAEGGAVVAYPGEREAANRRQAF